MKHLTDVFEGILGGGLDDTIEAGVYDNRIAKLIDKWLAKDYNAGKGVDMFGNELNIGDYIMLTDNSFVEFGQIIETDWSTQYQLTIIKGTKSQKYKVSAEDVVKLEPKRIYNILKELCAH